MNTLEQAIPQTKQTTTPEPEFGSGRYSTVARFCYNEAIKILNMTPAGAELFAIRTVSEVGRAMKGVTYEESIKVGRTGAKSGTLSVAETLKGIGKKREATPELELLHALQVWANIGKDGWSYGNSKPVLAEDLANAVMVIEADAAEKLAAKNKK